MCQYHKPHFHKKLFLHLVVEVVDIEVMLVEGNSVHISSIRNFLYGYPSELLFGQKLGKSISMLSLGCCSLLSVIVIRIKVPYVKIIRNIHQILALSPVM